MRATDPNGTRFHLLLGDQDWSPRERGLAWRGDAACLTLRPLIFRVPRGEPLAPDSRRAAGRDRYGNWYAIAPDRRSVTFLAPDEALATPFWPVETECPGADTPPGGFHPVATPEPVPPELTGLAVTTRHYLVVGASSPAGLFVFDLHDGGPPFHLAWPFPFRPTDLAPRPDGGVWVLDHPSDGDPRLWALDRYFRVEGRNQGRQPRPGSPSSPFQPLVGDPPSDPGRTFPTGLSLEQAVPVDARAPVAIEALPDDTVLVLEVDAASPATTLSRYAFGERWGGPVRLDEMIQTELAAAQPGSDPVPLWPGGHDHAFVPDTGATARVTTGTLYVVGREGEQAFAFDVRAERDLFSVRIREGFYPLRRFTGKGLVRADGRAYYDLEDRWLPVTEQPRPRFVTSAAFTTGVLDGRVPGCVWHRLLLDACLPDGTQVDIESRAADEPTLIEGAPWRREPRLYRRGTGAELPHYRAFSPDELRREGTGVWETLFQSAVGRYLQLRLTLRGTGRATPRIHALRAHYPRFSYPGRHLPAVYGDDAASASFLERFLANAEGLLTELEGRIADAQVLFDERTTDPEYLQWLASWLGAELSPAFDEHKRRLFIRHAARLFSERGTRGGLIRLLQFTLDPCPDDDLFARKAEPSLGAGAALSAAHPFGVRIVELFQTRRAPGVVLGNATEVQGPRLVTRGAPWTPDQGATALHARYREFLRTRHGSLAALRAEWDEPEGFTLEQARLSPVPPAHPGRRADWRAFVRTGLGFQYAETAAGDEDRYRDFLRRRYRRVQALKEAYRRSYASFAALTLPGEDDFPRRNPRLHDWIEFVSRVLPLHRDAHRFLVLVPTVPGQTPAEQARLMALVEDIVGRERPAHTRFTVEPYWALFRVGTARVGVDTVLGDGSRFAALLLGSGALSHGYAAPAHPADVPDRVVIGRDRLPPPATPAEEPI
jgi:phage tail-like protein